jgi:F-type H+-transporting ATPase subunit delta
MTVGAVAQRYARALLSSAADDNIIDLVGKDLEVMAQLIDHSTELKNLIQNPMFLSQERGAVVLDLATKLGAQALTLTFIKLLTQKGRLAVLAHIAGAYLRLADEHSGRVRANVRSTAPLLPDQLKRLSDALKKRTGKDIVLENQVDPDLLGGVVARVGDTVFDSSVRSHLTRIRNSILAG